MKVVAFLLILAGIVFLGDAIYDESRGVAAVISPTRASEVQMANRDDQPTQFRSLMAYQWTRSLIALSAGGLLFGIHRRVHRLDPFKTNEER